MTHPSVTVLMPVFNGAAHLRAAVDSVLAQTFRDFELLVIDDGSSDDSAAIIRSYHDARIRLLSNPRNLGLVATLNRGLDEARGQYIARLDCDDEAQPHRLERQLYFMDRHPEVGIAGSWFEKIQGDRRVRGEVAPRDADIRFMLLFDNAFLHSSMILRKSLLDTHGLRFDPAYLHAEDYEFWVRCARHTDMANLPEVLTRYRDHLDNISNRYHAVQTETADRVRLRHLQSLGIEPNAVESQLHLALINFRNDAGFHRLTLTRDWLETLTEAVQNQLQTSEELVQSELGRRWYGACGAAAGHGLPTWWLHRSCRIGLRTGLHWQWKLLLRCLARKPIPAADAENTP